MNLDQVKDNIIEATIFIVVVTAVTAAGAMLWNVATSDGKVDYCYIEKASYDGTLKVYGHRKWRADRDIASGLRSHEEAKAITDMIGCEVK